MKSINSQFLFCHPCSSTYIILFTYRWFLYASPLRNQTHNCVPILFLPPLAHDRLFPLIHRFHRPSLPRSFIPGLKNSPSSQVLPTVDSSCLRTAFRDQFAVLVLYTFVLDIAVFVLKRDVKLHT